MIQLKRCSLTIFFTFAVCASSISNAFEFNKQNTFALIGGCAALCGTYWQWRSCKKEVLSDSKLHTVHIHLENWFERNVMKRCGAYQIEKDNSFDIDAFAEVAQSKETVTRKNQKMHVFAFPTFIQTSYQCDIKYTFAENEKRLLSWRAINIQKPSEDAVRIGTRARFAIPILCGTSALVCGYIGSKL
jgi:hypothetical protein